MEWRGRGVAWSWNDMVIESRGHEVVWSWNRVVMKWRGHEVAWSAEDFSELKTDKKMRPHAANARQRSSS